MSPRRSLRPKRPFVLISRRGATCWSIPHPRNTQCRRGDSFASGFFYGLLAGLDADRALTYGVAHGALAMTTPGDTSMATLAEVERVIQGAGARVDR